MWYRLTLEKKISSWKLMASPFSSWIHPFPIKNCSIYNSTAFFYQSSKYLMPVCAVDNFWGELDHQCLLGRGHHEYTHFQLKTARFIIALRFFINLVNIWCLYVRGQFLRWTGHCSTNVFLAAANYNFQEVKFESWGLFKRYPNEIRHTCCTNTVKPASQISGELLNSYWFIGHLKCTATPCVDSRPQSVRRWVKSGITPQAIPDKRKKY